MDMRTVHPSMWFSASDFDAVGKEFTIGNVMMQQVQAEFKPCMFFQGQEKGLVINPTNNKLLIAILGWESNDWVGKKIVLFSYNAMFNNQPQLRLGVRAPDGKAPSADGSPVRQYGKPATVIRSPDRNPEFHDDEVPF